MVRVGRRRATRAGAVGLANGRADEGSLREGVEPLQQRRI